MTFAGVQPATLAAAAGAAGAVIVALYLLKLRRRRLKVPFAPLWAKVLEARETSSLWRRLRRLLSLLLQLALLAALALALADPQPGRGAGGRTIAILVDAGASMQATDVAKSRFERAKAEARTLIEGLSAADRALIVRLDAQPVPLGGPSADAAGLERQLDAITPCDAAPDWERGLALAADLTRGQPNPTVIVISDGASAQAALDRASRTAGAPGAPGTIDLAGIDLRWVPIGARGDNVGIVGFAVRRYPQNRASYEVLLEVESFRDAPAKVRLELAQEGDLVDVQHLELQPGERQRRIYPNLAGSGARLEARLLPEPGGAPDDLALDDRAYALVPPLKHQRVLVVTSGNLFLEGALLLDENASIDRLAPAAWNAQVAKGYDALVFDGFTPPEPLAELPAPALYLDPHGESSPFPIRGELHAPRVTDVASKHPLMRGVSLGDLNTFRASVFALQPGEVALAQSARSTVAAARETPRKAVAIGFDPRRSDLPLRVGFPVLLLNTLNWFAGDEATLLGSYPTGRAWKIPLPTLPRGAVANSGAATVTVRDPDGAEGLAPVEDGVATWFGRRAGFHTVIDGGRSHLVAANLADPRASRILPARTLTVGGAALAPPDGFHRGLRSPLWVLLVLAALALALAEWLTYQRRVTV